MKDLYKTPDVYMYFIHKKSFWQTIILKIRVHTTKLKRKIFHSTYNRSKLPLPLIYFADYGTLVSDFHTVIVKVIELALLFMYFDIDILWLKSIWCFMIWSEYLMKNDSTFDLEYANGDRLKKWHRFVSFSCTIDKRFLIVPKYYEVS